MKTIKILILKFQLWREMRPLSEQQKKQLINRIWWEFSEQWEKKDKVKHIELQIFATQKYKEQIAKRFFNN